MSFWRRQHLRRIRYRLSAAALEADRLDVALALLAAVCIGGMWWAGRAG